MNVIAMFVPPANTTPELVAAYLGNLKRNGAAAATLKKYRPYLRDFTEWVGDRRLADLTTWDVEVGFLADWVEAFECRHGRQPSSDSLRGIIGCLSSFYGFLAAWGLLRDMQ